MVLLPRIAGSFLCLLLLGQKLTSAYNVGVSLVQVGRDDVFFTLTVPANALSGKMWSFLTNPSGSALSESDLRSGVGRLGTGLCMKASFTINTAISEIGLISCGLEFGGSYTMHTLFQDVNNTATIVNENVSIPEEPNPLPAGPFCYDVDRDYQGAQGFKIVFADTAILCQAVCARYADCRHFRYTYSPALSDYKTCSLLKTGPITNRSNPEPGIITGPQNCSSRAVLYYKPRVNLITTFPSPLVREVPSEIQVNGENFDPQYDRIVVIPWSRTCGQADTSPYEVNGTSPSTFVDWVRMLCNNTGSANARLFCGVPPTSVIFSQTLGKLRVCVCDAGETPFGCDYLGGRPEYFSVYVNFPELQVRGPYLDQTKPCAAGRACTITGILGYGLRTGDKIMLRESCNNHGSPAVKAYSSASQGSEVGADGGIYVFDEPNLAVCPPNHQDGPCETSRMCWCPAGSPSTHSCTQDSDFIIDAGEMVFNGPPGIVDNIVILQEDSLSFTVRWDYPSQDGGGPVRFYTVFFYACAGGNYTDGLSTDVVVPAEIGENRYGIALNASYQFREPLFSAIPVPLTPATRYCVKIQATNDAGSTDIDTAQVFAWVTDVPPPTGLSYPDSPLYIEQGASMTPLVPQVTVQDCRDLPSVANTVPNLRADDCEVQNYDISPPLPSGLTINPSTGVISGTPLEVRPRPGIYTVTATNAGGKTSCFISLGIAGRLENLSFSMCLSSFALTDAVVTFQTPSGSDGAWYSTYAAFPQTLRITVTSNKYLVLYRTDGAFLGDAPRSRAIACGSLLGDTSSSSDRGFPPPTLCHWEARGVRDSPGSRADLTFQGGATFEAGQQYQMVLKVRVAPEAVSGQELLKLELFPSEKGEDHRSHESELFGAWTPTDALRNWLPALSPRSAAPLDVPYKNSPFFNGKPSYEPGFKNPLLGDVPNGLPYPWGFPAPGPTTCFNYSSDCPTSPHEFANMPSDTAWYQDTDPDSGMFPAFASAVGSVPLIGTVLRTLLFNPFNSYKVSPVERVPLPIGQVEPLYESSQGFRFEYALALDASGSVTLQRDVTICPSSPLRMPLMTQGPVCAMTIGPPYISCLCDPTLPLNHSASRCDRIQIVVSAGGDLRSTQTAQFVVSTTTGTFWAGFQPVSWYVQVKTMTGGLYSFVQTANAGLTAWHDFLLEKTTQTDCANECLSRLVISAANNFPCRSFKFHKKDKDCYLSRYVVDANNVLKRDFPGDVYDYYQWQEQLVYSAATQEFLWFSGLFITSVYLQAITYLQPPEPSAPPFDVPHFFPSYVSQPLLVLKLSLLLAVPIHGQDDGRVRVKFTPPTGFRGVSLAAWGEVPLPLGFGYCAGGNYSCSWYVSRGQALFPDQTYVFAITVHNPPDPRPVGELWTVQVITAGFAKASEGDIHYALPVSMAHPLPVDEYLIGCAVHFAPMVATPPVPAMDLYFVLARPWLRDTRMRVVLPEAFPLPASGCSVELLTPWLQANEVSCQREVNKSAVVLSFTAPLNAGAAVGLRLSPFQLPSHFSAVHPGFRASAARDHDRIEPTSLNIRLESVPAQASGSSGGPDQVAKDACHPAVWSCGLYPLGWAAADMAIRPSKYSFASVSVRMQHAEPLARRTGWAIIEFLVNTTLSFGGTLKDVVKLSPPYGYSLLGVNGASFKILTRAPESGQLNLARAMELPTALSLSRGTYLVNVSAAVTGVALRVPNLIQEFRPGDLHHINVSIALPSGGVEPSLLDPLNREPGRSACSNSWGLALEAGGLPMASAFTPGQPLAVVEKLQTDCTSKGTKFDNILSVSFVTTSQASAEALPKGSTLVLLLKLSLHFELVDPGVAADFAAPFGDGNRSLSSSTAALLREQGQGSVSSVEGEQPAFRRLGCPKLAIRSLGRRLRQEPPSCSMVYNDLQDSVELLFNASQLLPSSKHEILLRVRNPRRAGPIPKLSLTAYRTAAGIDLSSIQLPVSLSATGGGAGHLVPLQESLEIQACDSDEILPAMQAEVFGSLCNVPGETTEVSMGFVSPVVLQAPVNAIVTAPVGYRLNWACLFNASQPLLPAGRVVDYLQSSSLSNCVMSPDGRSANFSILANLKSNIVWTSFTIHAVNPEVSKLPATEEQSAWRVEVGGFASAGGGIGGVAGGRGMLASPLKVFTDMTLGELPYAYSNSTWALILRFRSATAVPTGGYFLLAAPEGFTFPQAHCRDPNATGYTEEPGSIAFVPALPTQPFRQLPNGRVALSSSELAIAKAGGGLPKRQPLASSCQVLSAGQRLLVSVLEGQLVPGIYEFRFAVSVSFTIASSSAAPPPSLWALESWMPAAAQECKGSCCPNRRPNFRTIIGVPFLEQLDQGVLGAIIPGTFRHRQLVPDPYGGWRFSDGHS